MMCSLLIPNAINGTITSFQKLSYDSLSSAFCTKSPPIKTNTSLCGISSNCFLASLRKALITTPSFSAVLPVKWMSDM